MLHESAVISYLAHFNVHWTIDEDSPFCIQSSYYLHHVEFVSVFQLKVTSHLDPFQTLNLRYILLFLRKVTTIVVL